MTPADFFCLAARDGILVVAEKIGRPSEGVAEGGVGGFASWRTAAPEPEAKPRRLRRRNALCPVVSFFTTGVRTNSRIQHYETKNII